MFMGWHFLSFIAIKTTLFQRCTVFCHLFRWKNIVLKATAVLKLITEKTLAMVVKLEVMRSFQVLKKLEVITKVNLRYFRRSWYRIHLWRAANGYRLQRHWGKWPWSFGTWCGRKQYASVKWEPPPERKLKDNKLK